MDYYTYRLGERANRPRAQQFVIGRTGPDAERYGAFHTSEVPYVFNTLHMSKRPWTDEDHEIADTLGTYWVNFMATGDPNGKVFPHGRLFERIEPTPWRSAERRARGRWRRRRRSTSTALREAQRHCPVSDPK